MKEHDIDSELFDPDILEPMDYDPVPDTRYDDSEAVRTPMRGCRPAADAEPEPAPEPRPRPRPRPKPQPKPKPKPKPKPEVDPAVAEAERRRRAERAAQRREAFVNSITDRRIAVFAGVVCLLVAAYLIIVSIGYFVHGAQDQSIVSNPSAMERAMNGNAAEVRNTGGPIGAWIADVIISQWLGVGALIMVFYVAALGLSLVRLRKFKFWNLTSRCLITAIATSVVLGFVSVVADDAFGLSGHMLWGGRHGLELNRLMVTLTGWWGAAGVSLLLVALVLLIYYNDIRAWWRVWQRHMEHRREVNAIRREERERREAAREERRRAAREREDREAAARRAAQAQSEKTVSPAEEAEESEPSDESEISEPEEPAAPAAEPLAPDDEMQVEAAPEVEAAEEIVSDTYDPTAELSRYRFPDLDLLIDRGDYDKGIDDAEQEENKERIIKTLSDYGIPISSIKATVGPTVTLYEVVPAEGVRIAKIKRLEDDIALSLRALGIRIIAPIPGKGTVGIEVPNKDPRVVGIRTIIGSRKFQESRMELPMALGCTISNEVFMADLTKMPHLLVAGATGMGKSVGLNAIITSLLYKKHPAELKFVLVDPKMVEFSLYSKLEHHYLAKLPDEDEAVVTNVNKAVTTLQSLCIEMDRRYDLLKDAGMRTIKEYNAKFVTRTLNPEKGHRYLPYIVVIVDEFADLIMQVGKEVETPIARIAQKARAVGIHMILATQRPSTNVITGVIKANFPGRIAFRVFQMVDSRTILDRPGANQLIGRGDMLFSTGGQIERVQCAFVDTPEVDAICEAIEDQQGYATAYELPEYVADESDSSNSMAAVGDRDPLFEECARIIVQSGQASTSSLQRRYQIGYNRAGKIMDQLEYAGVVGPSQGSKPRQVLVDIVQLESILGIPAGE